MSCALLAVFCNGTRISLVLDFPLWWALQLLLQSGSETLRIEIHVFVVVQHDRLILLGLSVCVCVRKGTWW